MTYAMQRDPPGSQRAFILPMQNAGEAALVFNAVIYPATTLLEVCAHLCGSAPEHRLERYLVHPETQPPAHADFSDVKGQLATKRALEVAAAGFHSVLMTGPPGAGKTMLASRFGSLLPPMSEDDALESAAVQSLNGHFNPALWKVRPFRSPHHTSSGVALVGGGCDFSK
jgi:magnesium chelatase family protein